MKEYASPEAAFPEGFSQTIISRHKILQKIRCFFDSRSYIEVETPLRVRCPGIDPHIDALPSGPGFFLATSPELQMKRLLGPETERIYQITRAFRAEEEGPLHSSEFAILEWYRTGSDYIGLMDETEELIKFLVEEPGCETTSWRFPFERILVDDVFKKRAGWEPSKQWNEDRFFIDWVEKVEPFLKTLGGVFLFDFPAPLASLSVIKKDNPLVCERFELFMRGIETGNAFTELTDYQEHFVRFAEAARKRQAMGKEPYPTDDGFMESLRKGIAECSGIAVGVDRLIMALTGLNDIKLVQTFPMNRL